jgi:hypothetical protein
MEFPSVFIGKPNRTKHSVGLRFDQLRYVRQNFGQRRARKNQFLQVEDNVRSAIPLLRAILLLFPWVAPGPIRFGWSSFGANTMETGMASERGLSCHGPRLVDFLKFQNHTDDCLIADGCVHHGMVNPAIGPFDVEIFLNKIGAVAIDCIHEFVSLAFALSAS